VTAPGEPQRVEVLAWMKRTRRGASEAASQFWPAAVGEERNRVLGRIRKWSQIAREQGAEYAPPALGPAGLPAPGGQPTGGALRVVERPAPRTDIARMGTVERLEWQIAEVGADLQLAREQGDLRTVALLDKRLSELGGDLDSARSAASRIVKLDRTPAAIAEELEKRAKGIRLRVEMRRRAEERAAQAAARERDL
jgi:hypothetical protein